VERPHHHNHLHADGSIVVDGNGVVKTKVGELDEQCWTGDTRLNHFCQSTGCIDGH
jgi:hypothetical protein